MAEMGDKGLTAGGAIKTGLCRLAGEGTRSLVYGIQYPLAMQKVIEILLALNRPHLHVLPVFEG